MIDQYEILESLSGLTGNIRKARRLGKEICVKIIKKALLNKESLVQIEREKDICRILEKVNHENIIKYYDIIEKDDTIYFFMEWCPTTLKQYLESKQFTYQDYLQFIYQISSGYKKLIELEIIHRDIKIDNIVLNIDRNGKPVFKIIDFGTSKLLGQSGPENSTSRAETKNIGTQLYMAPELLDSQEESYDNSCDIYSLGMVIIVMICGLDKICTHKWVENVKLNIKQNSIKEYIEKKESLPSQILDIVDCMVTARKWRITWEYLNARVEQLMSQAKIFRPDFVSTPPKIPKQTQINDNILTAKKFIPFLQQNIIGFEQNNQFLENRHNILHQNKSQHQQSPSQALNRKNNKRFLNFSPLQKNIPDHYVNTNLFHQQRTIQNQKIEGATDSLQKNNSNFNLETKSENSCLTEMRKPLTSFHIQAQKSQQIQQLVVNQKIDQQFQFKPPKPESKIQGAAPKYQNSNQCDSHYQYAQYNKNPQQTQAFNFQQGKTINFQSFQQNNVSKGTIIQNKTKEFRLEQ